jgi:hypothetical protein
MATEIHVLAASEATEEELTLAWRFEQLKRAGFDPQLAAELAVHPDVDLHGATELVRRGCDPALAARILL